MSWLMALLGGVAQHYAQGDPPSGARPAGAGWYLAQKRWEKSLTTPTKVTTPRNLTTPKYPELQWPGGPRPNRISWPGER